MNTELYEKLKSLQWLLKKQHRQRYSHKKPMADASRGQGRILAFLKMKDGISTKDLSYLLGMHISSLNEFIAKLEKSGYVTRMPSESDKRVMLTYLTEKGKQDQEEPEVTENDVFSGFTEEEKNTFGQYLDRIISLLEEEVGTEDGDMLQWMESAENHMGREHFKKMMKMQKGRPGDFCHRHSGGKSSDSSRDDKNHGDKNHGDKNHGDKNHGDKNRRDHGDGKHSHKHTKHTEESH